MTISSRLEFLSAILNLTNPRECPMIPHVKEPIDFLAASAYMPPMPLDGLRRLLLHRSGPHRPGWL